MEVSAVGLSKSDVFRTKVEFRKLGLVNSWQNFGRTDRVRFDRARKLNSRSIRVAFKGIRSEISQSEKVKDKRSVEKSENRVRLFVGLPQDSVSTTGELNHVRAISAGLRALKLLGIEGVEFPIFWGVAEPEQIGNYNWSGYLQLAEIVRNAGLKLRIGLCFHASKKDPSIPLPQWVTRIGETQPDIYFTDRFGKRYKDCLSFAVDELPVLDAKCPVQIFEAFFESFKSTFSDFLGSTITDITIGLGPNGDLRFPSTAGCRLSIGAGEFQCYDKHMLADLRRYARSNNHENWGYTGPHDAPGYDQNPAHSSFFRDSNGSWDSPYGQFFLSWYSSHLLSHADRLLSLSAGIFSGTTLSAKIPLLRSHHNLRSYPSELTGGYYHTDQRNGYDALVELFARHSCNAVLNFSDGKQEPLLSTLNETCARHGVPVCGESFAASKSFDVMMKNLSKVHSVDSVVYQRMGAYFFSPEHWPLFTEFVRGLDRKKMEKDDLPSTSAGTISLHSTSVATSDTKEMQIA